MFVLSVFADYFRHSCQTIWLPEAHHQYNFPNDPLVIRLWREGTLTITLAFVLTIRKCQLRRRNSAPDASPQEGTFEYHTNHRNLHSCGATAVAATIASRVLEFAPGLSMHNRSKNMRRNHHHIR